LEEKFALRKFKKDVDITEEAKSLMTYCIRT